jgi:predicted nucleic acid-binding protein
MVGHALVETYSVLTRLPGDARLAPMDAARLLDARFTAPLTLPAAKARRVPAVFAGLGIAGGAVYDALIGLTAAAHGVPLATRDGRATGTYAAVGAIVVPVG